MSYYTGRFPRRGAAAAAEGRAVLGVRLHHRVLHAQGRVRAARHAHPHKAPGEILLKDYVTMTLQGGASGT